MLPRRESNADWPKSPTRGELKTPGPGVQGLTMAVLASAKGGEEIQQGSTSEES